jgi:hypothetical protein
VMTDPYSDQRRDKGYGKRKNTIMVVTGPSDGHENDDDHLVNVFSSDPSVRGQIP